MNFKYSYEECLACEGLISHQIENENFFGKCKHIRSIALTLNTPKFTNFTNDSCKYYKPKGEVMGKKLTDFTLEQLNEKNFRRTNFKEGEYITRSNGGHLVYVMPDKMNWPVPIADYFLNDWKIVPEKKKVTIYVYKNTIKDEILVTQLIQTGYPNWELLDTIEKEYEV